MKELAPSTELREEFGHDPKLWRSLEIKYKKELKAAVAQEMLGELARIAKKRNVTLTYSAKDEKHNDAVALKALLEKGHLN